jgi:hypothetical protein
LTTGFTAIPPHESVIQTAGEVNRERGQAIKVDSLPKLSEGFPLDAAVIR